MNILLIAICAIVLVIGFKWEITAIHSGSVSLDLQNQPNMACDPFDIGLSTRNTYNGNKDKNDKTDDCKNFPDTCDTSEDLELEDLALAYGPHMPTDCGAADGSEPTSFTGDASPVHPHSDTEIDARPSATPSPVRRVLRLSGF